MERHRDQPFAIVGVNTDKDRDDYRAKVKENNVTWRSAWQGSTGGPIPEAWGVEGYPTVYVLDAQHRVRFVNVSGKPLDEAIEKLLAEIEPR